MSARERAAYEKNAQTLSDLRQRSRAARLLGTRRLRRGPRLAFHPKRRDRRKGRIATLRRLAPVAEREMCVDRHARSSRRRMEWAPATRGEARSFISAG